MKKIWNGWGKLSGLMRMAVLAAVIALCTAAVFSFAGGKAQNGTKLAGNDLRSSLEQFFGLEQTGDGLRSSFLHAAFSTGEWQHNPLAFHVPTWAEENTGVLSLQVDRALAGEDLVLCLTYESDTRKGSLYIGLSYWPEDSDISANESAIFLLGDLFGNIMQGQGEVVSEYFEIPIQSFPDAQYLGVNIYRGQGEITVYGAVLYPKSEFYYWLDQALAPGVDGLETEEGTVEQGKSKKSVAPVVADSVSGVTIGAQTQEASAPGMMELVAKQIAAANQQGTNYRITRFALDGGGTRQTSTTYMVEDSIGQASAIGFSYRGALSVHGGYQQADDERLEIWNVGVIPSEFNPRRGEVTALSYVLSTRSPNVTIEFYNAVTNTLVDSESQGAGLHTLQWDGRDVNGNYVDLGEWTLRIRGSDYQGRVVTTNTGVSSVRFL